MNGASEWTVRQLLVKKTVTARKGTVRKDAKKAKAIESHRQVKYKRPALAMTVLLVARGRKLVGVVEALVVLAVGGNGRFDG